ncbi:sugar phosphate isomerase/epimerase family protein [Cryptosporangium phraense]|uniref:Sugar phosphate isomerase/epimerase n=1 Tax=Cryptosporangium phraense TaxID=2593070 RepID=A0A545AVT3_9ACTN|nr:sugar phosphate isomerase/epimerase [Cryptosporangium phraense]TQS45430.1 sugar phosphate isomerase/epimerase [Cryptosporangium phraense]
MSRTLSVFQSLWAMEDLPWRAPARWTLAERVERIASAGFAGLAVDLGARQAPAAKDLAPLLDGLRAAVFCFFSDDAGLRTALDYADAIGAELVVGCGQVFPPDVTTAAGLVRGWLKTAAGTPFQLETHRYTLTNDLGFTVALLDAVPELELAVDLSHYVVGNELPDTADERTDDLIGRVLARAGSLQGRVATRGQVQVSPSFPQHAPAADRFRSWWTTGMAAYPGDDLVFCCELGTVPYAITGPDGEQISDRWADALLLKSWAEELFAATERRHP